MGNAKTKEILTKFFEFNMIGENDIDVLFDTYDKNKVRKKLSFFLFIFHFRMVYQNGNQIKFIKFINLNCRDEADKFLTDMMTLAIKRTRTEIEKKKKKGTATDVEDQQLMWAEDREKNLPTFVKECFEALDVDGNGTIDRKEFASYFVKDE